MILLAIGVVVASCRPASKHNVVLVHSESFGTEHFEVYAFRSDGDVCTELRLAGHLVSGGCGFRLTASSRSYAPNVGLLPLSRATVVFGSAPLDAKALVVTTHGGTREIFSYTNPAVSGTRFFTAVFPAGSEPLGPFKLERSDGSEIGFG